MKNLVWNSVNRDLEGGNMVNDNQNCFTENMSCLKKPNLLGKVAIDKGTA